MKTGKTTLRKLYNRLTRKATPIELYSMIMVGEAVYLNCDFKSKGAGFLVKMDLVLAALVVIPILIKVHLSRKAEEMC